MSGTSLILPFSQGAGANVMSQADYNADAQRLTGHQPGVARAQLANKQALQSSLMAAALAKFIADFQANNVSDDLTAATVADYLRVATQAAGASALGGGNQVLAYGATPGYQKFPGGIIFQWGTGILPITGTNQSNVTIAYPITFPGHVIFGGGFAIGAADVTNVIPTVNPWAINNSNCQWMGGIPNAHTFAATVVFGWLVWGY